VRTYGYACPSCNCLLEFFGLSHDERRVCAHCGSVSRLEAGDAEWRAVIVVPGARGVKSEKRRAR